MKLDPFLVTFVGTVFILFVIGSILRYFKQPYVLIYLIAGILLGPFGFGIIQNKELLSNISHLGVDILLFFVGMEICPKKLIQNWKIAVSGVCFEILISLLAIWGIGAYMGWPVRRIVLIGFVVSLSSTAVVIKMLQDWHELNTKVGQNTLSILLVQDLAFIPMFIILNTLGGRSAVSGVEIGLQIIGGCLMAGIIFWIFVSGTVKLPFSSVVRKDHELQVFASLAICFGLALLTGLLGLSTALGAFIAGMIVTAAKETEWVHHSLEPFRVVFVALFFASVGMMINPLFIWKNVGLVIVVVGLIFISNSVINAFVMRIYGGNWTESLYFGALLSQIGEFSFVLAAAGLNEGVISNFGYQMTISIITLSLMLCPFWIGGIKRITKYKPVNMV